MSRFQAIGQYVYEKGERIGCTPEEAADSLACKLNGYQMRIERLKAENERLRKAGDKMAKILDAHERVYNGCPSVEADSWWIARDGGCP